MKSLEGRVSFCLLEEILELPLSVEMSVFPRRAAAAATLGQKLRTSERGRDARKEGENIERQQSVRNREERGVVRVDNDKQ